MFHLALNVRVKVRCHQRTKRLIETINLLLTFLKLLQQILKNYINIMPLEIYKFYPYRNFFDLLLFLLHVGEKSGLLRLNVDFNLLQPV
jgi:hypothetical protein